MDSPSLMLMKFLMEFQREARSHFTMEVASVLLDAFFAVERGRMH